MQVEGFEVPAPGKVHKGQRVAFGEVQLTRRSWYLVTTDGEGVLGNQGRRGGPGVGCGCQRAVSRMFSGPNGAEPVRYLFVGGVPDDHGGIAALGYVCGRCNRALRQPTIPRPAAAPMRRRAAPQTGSCAPAAAPIAAVVATRTRPDRANKLAVANALLTYVPAPVPGAAAAKVSEPRLGGQDSDADTLLVHDPFALLVGLIAQYGVKAERAWLLPYRLQQRLGHLDPRRLTDPSKIGAAIARPPALHRFAADMGRYIASAARLVRDSYGSDTARIWSDRPSAVELDRRLQNFAGIGQKKAMLAIQVLTRDFRIPIQHMAGADVAYDVHIRRVFLRAGLADRDDRAGIVEAARDLRPEAPGDLDLPAWFIGREWCRPIAPLCGSCPIGEACPRLIERAALVHGV